MTINAGTWEHRELRIKVDVHSEYYTITYYLDALPHTTGSQRPTDDEQYPYLTSTNPSEEIYNSIWDRFDGQFGTDLRSILQRPNKEKPPSEGNKELGSLIGDARGYIIRTTSRAPAETIFQEESRRPKLLSLLGIGLDGLPLRQTENIHRAEPNVVLTSLDQYKVIYGSDLGNPRIASADGPQEPVPVKYFLLHLNDNDHQIGLAVHRANTLIELRLASLIDRYAIAKVSQDLRFQGDHLTKYLLRSANYSVSGRVLAVARYRYERLATNCHGGLIYRISQSERYYRSLMDAARDTQRTLLDGRQDYVQILRQNHEHIMKSTQAVGERHRRMGERIDRFIAAERLSTQKNITLAGVLVAFCVFSLSSLNILVSSGALLPIIKPFIAGIFIFLVVAMISIFKLKIRTWIVTGKMFPPEFRDEEKERRRIYRQELIQQFKLWSARLFRRIMLYIRKLF